VPVKIVIDSSSKLAGALRPGLSVEIKVDVRQNTGPSYAESGAPLAHYARRGETR